MAQGKGYWAKGTKIIPISIHIQYIMDHPEDFLLSKEKIKEVYKKHKEKYGIEGKAREEIIKSVLSQGWLRVRHYTGRGDYWSIQFDNYKRRKTTIKSFINKMFMDEISQYDDLVLMGMDDNYKEKISADDFLKENKEIKEYEMIIEEQHNNFLDVLDELS